MKIENKTINELIAADKEWKKADSAFVKKHKIYAIIQRIVILAIFVMAMGFLADHAKADIQITDPGAGDIITNFDITALVIDNTSIAGVTAKIGNNPITLSQVAQMGNQSQWTATAKITDYPTGSATITAYYTTTTDLTPHYVSQAVKVNLIPPATSTAGSATFTLLDFSNNPITGVTVQPTGNKTDSTGKVTAGAQPLNTQITFTFTKTGYNTTTTTATFTTNSPQIAQTVTLRAPQDDLKTFTVSGLSSVVEQNTLSYVKVRDSANLEYISGARVTVMNGAQIKSIPGDTISGRATVSYNEVGEFDIIIEKYGYKDYLQTVTVIASRVITPTQTPTQPPTPAPTPETQYRPDANMKLTDDEYRQYLAVQEEKTRQANLDAANATAANQSIAYTPPPPDNPPYMTYALVGAVGSIGVISYISSKRKKKQQPQEEDAIRSDDTRLSPTSAPGAIPTKTLKCPGNKCEWEITIPGDLDEVTTKAVLESHERNHNV